MYKTSTAFNQAIKNGERIYVKVKCGNFIFGYNDETDPTSPNEQNNIMELNIDRSISHDDYALAKSYACGCNCVLWAVPAGAVLRGQKTVVYFGCMVNGAGLAMATMDIIKLYGGQPANFLDVGGGATKERVIEAFKIILADTSVQGVLINIFGGIVRCDMIAEAIIAAVQEVNVTVPVVVRLEGNNAELGAKLLDESGLKLISAQGLADAAEKIVAAVKG